MASGCPTRYPLVKMFVEPGQIYLHCGHVDFRKSINGLLVIIEHELTLSPFTDAMFIFCNRNQDKLKIVYWDKTCFAMWYKVLQKDRFKWPKLADMQHIQLSEQQLQWLLSGMDIIGHQPLYYDALGL
jgi:transposase